MRQFKLNTLLFIYMMLGLSTVSVSQQHIIKWTVEKNSTLFVHGSSNVNNFTCDINGIAEKDTILLVNTASGLVKLTGAIKMDVTSFDCHNYLIRKDLRKTLKADQYPKMIIRFLTLKTMPLLSSKTEQVTGWVEVELAGMKKTFELTYTFKKTSPGIIWLKGGRNFSFSDFRLSAPRKLAGLVKIKDEFIVNFQLVLKTL